MPTEKDLNITAVYVEGTVTYHYSGIIRLELPEVATLGTKQRAAIASADRWDTELAKEKSPVIRVTRCQEEIASKELTTND